MRRGGKGIERGMLYCFLYMVYDMLCGGLYMLCNVLYGVSVGRGGGIYYVKWGRDMLYDILLRRYPIMIYLTRTRHIASTSGP